eukprot:4826701-Pyramimonas_sp.AAC.1
MVVRASSTCASKPSYTCASKPSYTFQFPSSLSLDSGGAGPAPFRPSALSECGSSSDSRSGSSSFQFPRPYSVEGFRELEPPLIKGPPSLLSMLIRSCPIISS